MLAESFYETFSAQWFDAWNAHDLERVLALYDEAFQFSSPVLAKVDTASGGRLVGKRAAREYWAQAFAARPDLVFEPIRSFHGVQSLVLHYRGVRGRLCAEFFVFSDDGKVVEAHAHECDAALP